uniref:GCV_T_C domain-containing protein n=1 Tax=Gongylonema pulchrum TaxID=637853 RepID=A0A183EXR1_9BILA
LNTNPYECGMSHIVLVICEPLTELQGWRTVPKRMEVIRKEGSEDRVGQITSGTYSVRLNRPLAFAWVHMDITPEDKSNHQTCFHRMFVIIYLVLSCSWR